MVQQSQGFFVVAGVRKFKQSIRNYWRPIIRRNQKTEITFSRKNISQYRINKFDMDKYIQQTNDKHETFYLFSAFSLFFTLSYHFTTILYDNDLRYYGYIRHPRIMKYLDDFIQDFNDTLIFLQNKLQPFDFSDVNSQSKYYQYKMKVKKYIFNTDMKNEEKEKIQQLTNIEIKQSDQNFVNIEEQFQEQDKAIIKKMQDKYK